MHYVQLFIFNVLFFTVITHFTSIAQTSPIKHLAMLQPKPRTANLRRRQPNITHLSTVIYKGGI